MSKRTFQNNLDDSFCTYEKTDNLNISDLINRTTCYASHIELTINKQDVRKIFTKVNVKKSVGPDGVCNKLLSVFSPTLSGVCCTVYMVRERRPFPGV